MGRFKTDGQHWTVTKFRNPGLVEPSSGEVNAKGRLDVFPDRGRAPWFERGMRLALEDNVFDSVLQAKLLFLGRMAVLVDDEKGWLDRMELVQKIHDAGAFVDVDFSDARQCLDHVPAFVLIVDGPPVLEPVDRDVRPDADVEFPIGGGFLQERDMPAVEHVEATRNHDPGSRHP